MGQRRRGREYALQLLFQCDVAGEATPDAFDRFWAAHPEAQEETRDFALSLVDGVRSEGARIDELIVAAARNWRLERMAAVDRNVLRLAVYELLHEPETPTAVVLDEAIEIAKRFGSGESGSFINGILDTIRLRLESGGAAPRGADGG